MWLKRIGAGIQQAVYIFTARPRQELTEANLRGDGLGQLRLIGQTGTGRMIRRYLIGQW